MIVRPMFVTNEAFTSGRLLSSSGASHCLRVMSEENSLVLQERTPNRTSARNPHVVRRLCLTVRRPETERERGPVTN